MTGDASPPPSRSLAVAAALRDAWHGLARPDDPAACPGCPACQVTDAVGRARPEALEHVEAALGHLAGAGRELLAALAAASTTAAGPPGGAEPTGAASAETAPAGTRQDGGRGDQAAARAAGQQGVRERIEITGEPPARPQPRAEGEEQA